MVEPTSTDKHQPASPGAEDAQGDRLPIRALAWAILSLGFLALLAFGSVEARIWRFNQLFFEDRRIFDVWSYQANHLPDVAAQRTVTMLYYGSVAILIVGTILGLRYLLAEAATGTRASAASPGNHAPGDD